MEYILYFFAFVFGTVVGSFLNVCIYRIPRGLSIVFPSSTCTTCGHRLNFIDLIPIFGYVIRKGKCKYCGGKISLRYPIVELLTGVLFLFSVYKFGFSYSTIFVLLFVSILVAITFIDIDFQIIPDEFNVMGVIIGFGHAFFNKSFLSSLYGMIIGVLFFVIIAYIGLFVFKKESIGGGDIKLAGALGAFLGWEILLSIFLSFAIGGILAIFLILSRIKKKSEYIPFGPAMVLGGLISIFFGDEIIRWYMSYFS